MGTSSKISRKGPARRPANASSHRGRLVLLALAGAAGAALVTMKVGISLPWLDGPGGVQQAQAAPADSAGAPLPSPPGAASAAAGTPPGAVPLGSGAGGAPSAGAPGTNPAAGDAASGGPRPKSDTIRLVVKVIPSAKRAFVFWGKKRLGVIDKKAPLIVQRPRDSGPMDLVVRADDCVPVYTRAYTFDDNTLTVKVTPNDQKQTIYGYKAELPPDDAAQGDAAAPGATLPGSAPAAAGGRGGGLFTR